MSKKRTENSIFQKSIILASIDKFCDAVYSKLTGGSIGALFSAYPDVNESALGRISDSGFRTRILTPARRAVASKLENSVFADLYGRFVKYLLSVRLRIYGVFLFSFLIYSAVFAAIGFFRGKSDDISVFVIPALISLGCIPILIPGKTLSQALASSKIGALILKIIGARVERLDLDRKNGRGDIALVLALFMSFLTFFVPFWLILAAVVGAVFVLVVFDSPEFGTICLFFFMPILPTVALAAIGVLTMLSFLLKAILARRLFRFEAIDLTFLPFVLFMLVATLFGASQTSLASGAIMIIFCCCFYLVVFTLVTREWLRRAAIALIISCAGISVYGIFQYINESVFGNAVENDWVDQKMFGYITGRATATLDNPNMLSVYLIIVLPIAFCALITLARNFRERFAAFAAFSVITLCLGLTWTRGAWLGALIALVILVMIWSRRSIYMFIAGIVAFPFLPYILPANIWARFSSIGNFADSSSAYRVNILKSAFELLPRFIMNGLGLGEESWYAVWTKIALDGVEDTTHTHNLFVQIWVQTGLVSLIVFICFIVLLFVSNFNFFRKLKEADDVIMSHISVGSLKESSSSEPPEKAVDVNAEKKKTVLRLEAAAPACGIFAALLMGLTDYIWYNYRVFLIFWLVCGLSSANVRVGRRELEYRTAALSPGKASAEIVIEKRKDKER